MISWVTRTASEGRFISGLDNNKTSPWNEVVNRTMFNSTKKGKYCDLSMEHKLLLKIQNENLLHFFMTSTKANVPKYIFRHMIKTLRESQTIERSWIPYRRLISEILHQGVILSALSETKIFIDKQLDTVIGKIINGSTLRHKKLIRKKDYKKLDTDLKESDVVSNLMEDFPPISMQDPLDVRVNFILKHYETTGETIRMEDIPKTMYGGALHVASKKKRKLTKEEYLLEADDDEEASEPQKKKAKKAKVAPQVEATGSDRPSILEEVQDLDPAKVLNKRTRSGKSVETSQPKSAHLTIPKKKRKKVIRKLKEASLAEEEEVATGLVTREIKRKKAADAAALKKVLELAKEIEVFASSIAREDVGVSAQEVIKAAYEVQDWVSTEARSLLTSAGALKETSGAGEPVKAAEEVQREEAAFSEATQGNTDSLHTANIIEIKSSSASPSHSTSISNSSDLDDVPLNKIYTTINKGLSPSTKLKKNPSDETFEPMYPSVLERMGEMSQMRVDICARLPADHPLQPPMIEPIQSLPADAEGVDEPAVSESANLSKSSHPKSTTQATEPSVLDDLVNHYSGELPGYEPTQEKASEVASDGVTLESPQQQTSNLQMASSTCTDIIIHPEYLPYHLNATHSNISFGIALRNLAKKRKPVLEQHVPKQVFVEPLES